MLNIIKRDSYILGDHLDFRPPVPLGECKCQERADSFLQLFAPDKVCTKRMKRKTLKLKNQRICICCSVQ